MGFMCITNLTSSLSDLFLYFLILYMISAEILKEQNKIYEM